MRYVLVIVYFYSELIVMELRDFQHPQDKSPQPNTYDRRGHIVTLLLLKLYTQISNYPQKHQITPLNIKS